MRTPPIYRPTPTADLPLFASDPHWLTHPQSKLERRFADWYALNPHIYAEFEKRTLDLYLAGARRIGMKAIAEVVRYHSALQSKGDPFKVNNSYVSFIARLLIHRYAKLADVIETREAGRRAA